MSLPSLVTVAAPAADVRARCLLQPPILSALPFLVPPPPWISSFLPFSGFPVSQTRSSSSAASSFLLTLCSQDFLPLICGAGRGAGGGFLPSFSFQFCITRRNPAVFSLYPLPRTFHSSSSVLRPRLPPQNKILFWAVIPSGPLKPPRSPGMGLRDIFSHLFSFPDHGVSHFCH